MLSQINLYETNPPPAVIDCTECNDYVWSMGVMTIRNIDEATKARLRVRAAQHGKSMEEEARDILRAALATEPRRASDLGRAIRERFGALGGVDLQIPVREPIRDPVDFAE